MDHCNTCHRPFTACCVCGVDHGPATNHLECIKAHGDEIEKLSAEAIEVHIKADLTQRLLHLMVHEMYWASHIDD